MSKVDDLLRCYPLDVRWTPPALFEESVVVGETRVELCGLSTTLYGEMATGSAAAVGESPVDRAFFELIERTSILEAMAAPERRLMLFDRDENLVGDVASARVFPPAPSARCVYARSNGVAVAHDFRAARDAARWELLERDRILRCWYGASAPLPTVLPPDPHLRGLAAEYDLAAYDFPGTDRESSVFVSAVFAFPRCYKHPIAYGFGAHEHGSGASAKAARECLQRLAFLWGEAVPRRAPRFAPNAEYHQEFFLQPRMKQRLCTWLSGKHTALCCGIRQHEQVYSQRRYVDLTPKALGNRLRVLKALPISEIELTFGHGHPRLESALPEVLKVHPVA